MKQLEQMVYKEYFPYLNSREIQKALQLVKRDQAKWELKWFMRYHQLHIFPKIEIVEHAEVDLSKNSWILETNQCSYTGDCEESKEKLYGFFFRYETKYEYLSQYVTDTMMQLKTLLETNSNNSYVQLLEQCQKWSDTLLLAYQDWCINECTCNWNVYELKEHLDCLEALWKTVQTEIKQVLMKEMIPFQYQEQVNSPSSIGWTEYMANDVLPLGIECYYKMYPCDISMKKWDNAYNQLDRREATMFLTAWKLEDEYQTYKFRLQQANQKQVDDLEAFLNILLKKPKLSMVEVQELKYLQVNHSAILREKQNRHIFDKLLVAYALAKASDSNPRGWERKEKWLESYRTLRDVKDSSLPDKSQVEEYIKGVISQLQEELKEIAKTSIEHASLLEYSCFIEDICYVYELYFRNRESVTVVWELNQINSIINILKVIQVWQKKHNHRVSKDPVTELQTYKYLYLQQQSDLVLIESLKYMLDQTILQMEAKFPKQLVKQIHSEGDKLLQMPINSYLLYKVYKR